MLHEQHLEHKLGEHEVSPTEHYETDGQPKNMVKSGQFLLNVITLQSRTVFLKKLQL